MELRQYGQLARKWLWLVILCALVAGGAAYIVSKKSTPIYQASAKLLISQAASAGQLSPGYQDILTSQQLARTYANLLADGPVVEGMAQRLGLPTDQRSIARLQGGIAVTPIRDTQLLEVKVEGADPTLIARIANTLPEVFIDRNQQLQMGRVGGLKTSLEKRSPASRMILPVRRVVWQAIRMMPSANAWKPAWRSTARPYPVWPTTITRSASPKRRPPTTW